MWLFKLILLLSLIASWLPIEGQSQDYFSEGISYAQAEEAEEQEEENEELAA